MLINSGIPKIEKPIVSYFASGESLHDLSPEDVEEIKKKTFLITTNYGFQFFPCDLNIHSDIKVTEYILEYLKSNKKMFQILSRLEAFGGRMAGHEYIVDYWFESRKLNLKSANFTVVWMLAWLLKNFPDKQVLLFGFDFYGTNKFYDSKIDWDKVRRGSTFNAQGKLKQCLKQLEQVSSPNFINCNLKSECNLYPKRNWKEVLEVGGTAPP